jgi:hypothetical protein
MKKLRQNPNDKQAPDPQKRALKRRRERMKPDDAKKN